LNRAHVVQLISTYFQSWVDQDFDMFNSVVHKEAVVRECNGAVIEGKAELFRWFTEWNSESNQVVNWNIKCIGFDEHQEVAFVEWTFKCLYKSKEYEWEGSSIVYFKDALMYEINEYEMKQDKYFPYRQYQG
jgi:hypothetical protein